MVETPLIRHGFAVPPSPLWGEGSRSTQIGWNCSHCGTFGYIYWELGRSAPVGGAGGRKGRPYDESQSISRNGGRGKPLPYGFPEMTLELGRGAPWVSRRGIRIRPAGGPVCRPYGVRRTSMAGG